MKHSITKTTAEIAKRCRQTIRKTKNESRTNKMNQWINTKDQENRTDYEKWRNMANVIYKRKNRSG